MFTKILVAILVVVHVVQAKRIKNVRSGFKQGSECDMQMSNRCSLTLTTNDVCGAIDDYKVCLKTAGCQDFFEGTIEPLLELCATNSSALSGCKLREIGTCIDSALANANDTKQTVCLIADHYGDCVRTAGCSALEDLFQDKVVELRQMCSGKSKCDMDKYSACAGTWAMSTNKCGSLSTFTSCVNDTGCSKIAGSWLASIEQMCANKLL
ncbi:hypothetical protein SNE40_000200 [Patella caerulea]|uniref:Uncharacterized protein n=1 Tax=Patella caerulea TaxID=87958 RepID=A0AAN8QGP4_PATCE